MRQHNCYDTEVMPLSLKVKCIGSRLPNWSNISPQSNYSLQLLPSAKNDLRTEENINLYSALQFERWSTLPQLSPPRKRAPASQHTLATSPQPPSQKHTHTHTLTTSCLTIQALPCGPLKCCAPLSKCKPYKDTEEQKPPRRATFCPAFSPS